MRIGIITQFSKGKPAGLERFLVDSLGALSQYSDAHYQYVVYTRDKQHLEKALSKHARDSLTIVGVRGGFLWKHVGMFFTPRSDIYVYNGPVGSLLFKPQRLWVIVYDYAYKYFPPERLKQKVKNHILDFLTGVTLKRAERIIAISRYTKEDTVRFFSVNEKKMCVIYPGFRDFSAIKPSKPESIRKPFFLTVGAMKRRKNVIAAVRAFAKFEKDTRTEHHLVIVGKDTKSSNCFQEIISEVNKRGLKNRVYFTGYISDEELSWLYENATALVYPSLLEGFGFPVLESLSVGTPVITLEKSSLKEINLKGVYHVYGDTPKEISEAMKRTAGLTPDERLSLKNQDIAKYFSWRRFVEEFTNT